MADTRESTQRQVGLGYWMRQVIVQLDKAGTNLQADPVHDLRVAIRRCRSVGEGLQSVDSDRTWKKMRRLGKQIFAPLGELRDVHVMMEWLDKLRAPDGVIPAKLVARLSATEKDLKDRARAALEAFDRMRWESWITYLSRRAQRVPIGSAVFEYLALERWQTGYNLHARATRSGNAIALHDLRIAVKKLRYMVETFLPQYQQAWGKELKRVQDLLGDIHDLDVLSRLINSDGVFENSSERDLWLQKIIGERKQRVQEYKQLACGKTSVWRDWRRRLPAGAELETALLAKFSWWASSFDESSASARDVASLALQLHDGIAAEGLMALRHPNARSLLLAAALAQEVGRSERKKGYHKASGRLIGELNPPVGWPAEDVQITAEVARYHRGALPQPGRNGMSPLTAENRKTLALLAGILRLANALNGLGAGKNSNIAVHKTAETLVIYAEGYDERNRKAEKVAAARHLLEVSCGVPVVVRATGSGFFGWQKPHNQVLIH
jgi:CHAD domain-containing protein